MSGTFCCALASRQSCKQYASVQCHLIYVLYLYCVHTCVARVFVHVQCKHMCVKWCSGAHCSVCILTSLESVSGNNRAMAAPYM